MKKTLTIILVIALLCVLSVGTTLTYFTDTDFDKNVMTVGEVQITQLINSSESGNASAPLYPYTGTVSNQVNQSLDTAKNAVNKAVTVKLSDNSEAAYIRTLFAFEADGDADAVGTMIHVNVNNGTVGTWDKACESAVTINGVKYYIYSFTYSNQYTKTQTTESSLLQFCLDGSAENNFSGGSYEILVLSQAVQAQGFTGEGMGAAYALNTAFGEVNATNATTWFKNLPTT